MATTVVLFTPAIRALLTGGMSLSDSYRCALMTSSWSPDNATSTVASLTAYWCTSGSNGQADRHVYPPSNGTLADQCTVTADGVAKFDLSDVVLTATTGQQIDARYGLVYASAATVPLGYWEISITAVTAAQFTAQWNADGLFETSR
jgi:hypothetical protein